MKNIASFLVIAAIGSACMTPAYAEEPKPDLPLPESPVPPAAAPQSEKKVLVSAAKFQQMATMISYMSIRFADQCQNNNPAWFCQADAVLKDLRAEPAPACPASPAKE